MKRLILLIFVLILTGCSANLISQPNVEETEVDVLCESAKGAWSEEYQECENVNKEWCSSVQGNFDECATSCRHASEETVMCTMQCVQVCSFDKGLENTDKILLESPIIDQAAFTLGRSVRNFSSHVGWEYRRKRSHSS